MAHTTTRHLKLVDCGACHRLLPQHNTMPSKHLRARWADDGVNEGSSDRSAMSVCSFVEKRTLTQQQHHSRKDNGLSISFVRKPAPAVPFITGQHRMWGTAAVVCVKERSRGKPQPNKVKALY